jgi:endonuclease/exonuclease/phosphatase family metal-dependent hydrolase
VRFVTLNLWGTHAPLAARLVAAARGLAALEPDVVLLQEVREGEGLPNTAATLASLVGAGWHSEFAAGTRGPAGTFGPGSSAGAEGVGLIARHPIEDVRRDELPEARPDERRVLLSARVAGVWVHTTHLHWRPSDGLAREAQVVAASAAARACGDGVHVLGGDFNAPPDADEIRYLAGRTTLAGQRVVWQDAFARVHPGAPGVTWARRNPMTAELAHVELERRIDYLWVTQEQRSGRGRVLDARVVLDAPDADGTWPSDHFGVLADVQI